MLLMTAIGIAKRREPAYTLEEQLETRTVKELRLLASLDKVPYYASLRKDELIGVIYEKVMDRDKLKGVLTYIGKKEWELFKEAASTRHIIDDLSISDSYKDYIVLFTLGYIAMYVRI